MPVNGINAGEFNLSDRYSGTRLFTVLNIKDFSCLARLSARLSHLRACIDTAPDSAAIIEMRKNQ